MLRAVQQSLGSQIPILGSLLRAQVGWLYAFLPRLLPSLPCFRAKAKICKEGSFLRGRRTQTNYPTTQKNGRGGPLEGKWLCGADPGGKQVCGEIRGACEERRCRFTRGLDHQRRHSTEGGGLCVVTGAFAVRSSLSSELPCSVGHRAAATFYFRASVHTPCECPRAAALKHGDDDTCYMCIDHCYILKFAFTTAGREKNFFKLFLCIGRYLGNPPLSHAGHGGIPQALSPGGGEPSCRVAACSGVGQRLLLGSNSAHPQVPASSSWDTTKGVCFQSYLTAPCTVL